MYNIVFLINKQYFDTKMSRVRFHSIRALFDHVDVNGIYTGPGWDNWDSGLLAQENLDNILQGDECHLVIGYKPLEISGFPDITYTKCIRYNEMYDKQWTLREITESKANVIVCHHYNDYKEYITILKNKKLNHIKSLTWVPHSAETSIFKPKPEIEKKYDVALVGATNVTTMLGEHYPLRARMSRLLGLMPSKYKCAVIPHVGGSHSDAYTDKYAHDFADKINSSKIIITDSGAPKSRFGKYIEVPMCGVALAGDIYDDHPKDVELLKSFLIDINMQMSDQEIFKKLVYYLENDNERAEKVKAGIEYTKDFTQERYAERFIDILMSTRKKRVNYFDLGLHSGLELRYMLTQVLIPGERANLINFRNYGFEACAQFALPIKKYSQLHPHLNITIIHKAISNTEDKIKLYHTDPVKQPEGVGHSIFRTKNNVTDSYEEVDGIIFSKWLKENVPNYKKHFNILKVNIEGAEWHLYKDLVDNNLLQYFPVILGSGHDVNKVSELDDEAYWKLIKDNNIVLHPFVAWFENNRITNKKKINIMKVIEKEFKLWKQKQT